jgi:hypothetical protein
MYSGSTLTPLSGKVFGAHQKIDRVARRHLSELLKDDKAFPGTKMILKFEGFNGPDAIKRKSPARDEPWHYYSPFNDEDSQLTELITQHYNQLVKNLRSDNRVRVAFEAAWLAHAITDGLTPAHHYPYEEKLSELRGDSKESRQSLKEKLIIQGDTRREAVKNNWKMWGPKGLFSTHGLFELGVSSLIKPLSLNSAEPTEFEVKEMLELGIIEIFKRRAREIAVLDMYDRFYKKGWTIKLMNDVRQKLAPIIVQTVTLSWYSALVDSEKIKIPRKYRI